MSKPVSLYFIQGAGRIKIGISTDVEKRLSVLRLASGEMLTLIAAVRGSWHLERHIHRMLAAHRLHGEWFTDCEDVRSLMATVLAGGGEAIGFEPPPEKTLTPTKDTTPHNVKISRLCDLMWPGDGLRELSLFSEQPEDTCALWLSGAVPMPRLLRMAFANRVVRWIFEQDKKSQEEKSSRLGGRVVASMEGELLKVPHKVAREAATLRRQGQSEEQIVAHFHGKFSWAEIAATIKHRNDQKNALTGLKLSTLGLGLSARKRSRDIDESQCETVQQERAQLCHTSLTSYLLGDPLPGESMLERRSPPTAPTTITSDPLDRLIYGRSKAV